MQIDKFLELHPGDISSVIKEVSPIHCVALMVDGTRRISMLESFDEWRDNFLIPQKKYYENMMYIVLDRIDFIWSCGVTNIVGPIASRNNLLRKEFIPHGALHLLEPLKSEKAREIFLRNKVKVLFYGNLSNLDRILQFEVVNEVIHEIKLAGYQEKDFKNTLSIGVGFSTTHDIIDIVDNALKMYEKTGVRPEFQELVTEYFGYNIPPIDIFIRTNELKFSGGLPPLLAGSNMQLYFPVSPGIYSLSEEAIKRIFYDFLFNRNRSDGKYEHIAEDASEMQELLKFYKKNSGTIYGVGSKLMGSWIARGS